MEEFGIPTVRQIFFDSYRILFDYDGVRVLILTIVHGSKTLKLSDLSGG